MKFKKVRAEWVDEHGVHIEAPEGERSRFDMQVEDKSDHITVYISPAGLSNIRLYHQDAEQAAYLGFSGDDILFCAWEFRTVQTEVFNGEVRVLGFVEGGKPMVEGSYNRQGKIGYLGSFTESLPGRLVQFRLT